MNAEISNTTGIDTLSEDKQPGTSVIEASLEASGMSTKIIIYTNKSQ